MFDRLRMIFILDRVRTCPKAQIKVLSPVKVYNKQHLYIFKLEQWGKYKLIQVWTLFYFSFIFTPKSMKTLMIHNKNENFLFSGPLF